MTDIATTSPDELVTPREVLETLRIFGLHESETRRMSAAIKTRTQLARVFDSLKATVLARLPAQIKEVNTRYNTTVRTAPSNLMMLLIAQGTVGSTMLHPAFQPLENELRLCGSEFDEMFKRILAEYGTKEQLIYLSPNKLLACRIWGTNFFELRTIPEAEFPFWSHFISTVIANQIEGRPATQVQPDLAGWVRYFCDITGPQIQSTGRDKILAIDVLVRKHLIPLTESDIKINYCNGQEQDVPSEPGIEIFYSAQPRASTASVPLVSSDGDLLGELVGDKAFTTAAPPTNGRARKADEELILAIRRELEREYLDNFDEGMLADCAALIGLNAAPNATEVQAAQLGDKLTELIKAKDNFENAATERLRSAASWLEHEFADQLQAIKNLANVQSVRASEQGFVIETDMICCRDDRTNILHEIGEFEINIPFAKGNPVVFRNRTRNVGGFQAPHVNSQGAPCLGNTRELFPELIQKRDFLGAAIVAIAFVGSVNTADSWGRGISNWPRATERHLPR